MLSDTSDTPPEGGLAEPGAPRGAGAWALAHPPPAHPTVRPASGGWQKGHFPHAGGAHSNAADKQNQGKELQE